LEIFSNPLRRDPPTALTCESGLTLVAAAQNFSHSHGTQKNAKIWDVGMHSIKAWFFQGGWFELPFFPRGHRHNPSKKDQYNPRAPSPGVRIVAFLIPKPVYISYYAIEVQSAASHLYHYIHRCEHKITTHSTMAAVCTAGKCLINTTEDRTDHNFHRSAERDFNQYPQLL
jgi:hypothetical protein